MASQRIAVGLAYVGLADALPSVLEQLAFARIRATFFVAPEDLVSEALRWQRAVADGHELGNGALLGATDDGRLPKWTFEAIEAELHSADRLLREFGMQSVESVFLPGHYHTCGSGRYGARIRQAYGVCLADAPKAMALHGATGQFSVFGPGMRTLISGAGVVLVRGDPDLAVHSKLLVRLAKYAPGPVRILSEPPKH